MKKITVLYKHPSDAEKFKTYYKETHLPLVDKIEGLAKAEITEIQGELGGEPSDYFLMAELYFKTEEQMQESMGSTEGQAVANDLSNFATGGVTIIIGNTVNW
ncbi:EthD family reductase [Winogradskyella schleiferi]|uniref:EthD family reductase n=1 Tax=Winogradskyella schleiferi TaxID=2686078 RepID=UPI0015BE91E5|nr:EthD family reductase [Winogradskyella schleiferi]